MRTKKFGFTLAEVLITLGIIGVVAAMTIPTLISNTNSAKFRSQYKKTLSTLNQAALMGTAQYDLDFASLTGSGGADGAASCDGTSDPKTEASICALINGTLSGATYLKVSDIKINGTGTYTLPTGNGVPSGLTAAYQLADGSMFVFNPAAAGCTLEVGEDITGLAAACKGFIDVNGPTLPNKAVVCQGTGGAGSAKEASTAGDCVVRNNAADMGDIFPVVFHDGTVEPLTNAARYVLNQSK